MGTPVKDGAGASRDGQDRLLSVVRDMHGGNGIRDGYDVVHHVMDLEAVDTRAGMDDLLARTALQGCADCARNGTRSSLQQDLTLPASEHLCLNAGDL